MNTPYNAYDNKTERAQLMEELPMLAHLKDTVRDLAVSIAKAMGEDAVHSSRHVSTAIAIARDIVSGRYREKLGGSTVVAEMVHGRWIVRRLDAEIPLASFSRRDDAMRRGVELAGRYDVDFIVFGPKRNVLERHDRETIRAPWMDIVRSHLNDGGRSQSDAAKAPSASAEEPLEASSPEPIRVSREGRRWTMAAPGREVESHRTKKAAMAAAEALASELGLTVEVA